MPVGQHIDPYQGHRFLVEIKGLVVGGFSEVSGLQVEIETEEYREGGVNDAVHKLPKLAKYPNLILKRGLSFSDTLWKWHQSAVRGDVILRVVYVILLDNAGNEEWRWVCEDAYPVKWQGADLKADNSAVFIETLELVHCGITKV